MLHLFCKATPLFDGDSVVAAVKAAEAAGVQVVAVSTLGHKCDAAFMAMHEDWQVLRALQTGLQRAGLEVVDSNGEAAAALCVSVLWFSFIEMGRAMRRLQ